MRNKPSETQAPHLDELCRVQAEIAVFMTNGVRLRGKPIAFDNHTVLLWDRGISQLVYKHSISTIVVVDGSRRARTPPYP